MRPFYVFPILGIVLFLQACQLSPLQEATDSVDVFFDLKGFIATEVDYLEANRIGIHKLISNKKESEASQTEEHQFDEVDWKKELRLFSSSDINRPSWKEKYSCDSIQLGNGRLLLQYKAKDQKLRTEMLDIEFNGDQVHSILIVNKRINQVYESQEYLTYIPRKSYTIEKTQDVTLFDKDEYNIQAKYTYHAANN